MFDSVPDFGKLFIVREWTSEPVSRAWIMVAESFDKASEQAAWMREAIGNGIEHYKMPIIEPLDQKRIFDDIGLPVFFDSRYHVRGDILIIPCTRETGFSKRTVEEMIERSSMGTVV